MARDRTETNPDVMGGRAVIRGTRISVDTVLHKLAAGVTVEAILADHPRLTRDDVLAVQDTSAYRLTDEQVEEVRRRIADPNPKRLTLEEASRRISRLIGE